MSKHCVVAATVLLTAALTAPAPAQVANPLVAAGFVMRDANTPEKLARLRSLPADKFVARKSKGNVYYVYADPKICVCAYVGNQQAMDTYRRIMAPDFRVDDVYSHRGVNVENQIIQDMSEDGIAQGYPDDPLDRF